MPKRCWFSNAVITKSKGFLIEFNVVNYLLNPYIVGSYTVVLNYVCRCKITHY